MIQMKVEITEHFADEILDEEDKLIGLEDFVCENLLGKEIAESFEWTKQEGATDADPDVYVGTLMVQTEGIYEFGVSYSDMASNDFELDEDTEGNALGGTNVSEDGEYQSITMILDTTSPVIKGTYLDKDKKDITADYVYDHVKYEMTIPAGAYNKPANAAATLDENGFAGFRRIASIYPTVVRP